MVIVLREIHTVSLRRIFSRTGRYEMAKPVLLMRRSVKGKKMWYAVWVRTGHEEKVLKCCREMLAGAESCEECFLPKYEKAKKVNGVWIRQKELLFPGYLFFISQNVEQLSLELKRMPEFAMILGDEEGPVPLQDKEVDFLKKYTNEDKVLEMSYGYMVGEQLVITQGPLKEYRGRVIHIDRHKRRAVLEMEFFGRVVRTKVGLEVVRKL